MTMKKQYSLLLMLAALLSWGQAAMAQTTLASWTFEGGYDVSSGEGTQQVYTPNGGAWAQVSAQWFNASTPIIRPDECVGDASSYTITAQGGRYWELCGGWNNHVFRFTNTEANNIDDITNAATHKEYYEVDFPTTGYKDITLEYAIACGSNYAADINVAISTDGGASWVGAGKTSTANTWWTYEPTQKVSVSANNKSSVRIRLLPGSGQTTNWNLDFLTIRGEKSDAGTVVDAKGVTATWTWDSSQSATTATLSQDGVVSNSGLTLGADLELQAPQTVGADPFNKVQPKTSNVAPLTDDDALTFLITPKNGLVMTPTHLHFKGARFGTNGGRIDVKAIAGTDTVTLISDAKPNRNNGDPSVYDIDIEGLKATYTNPFFLKLYVSGLANNKQMGFRDFVVTADYQGTLVELPSYKLNVSSGMAGAGNVIVAPAGAEFDQGTPVTLTATENFGYHFQGWADKNGNIVATDNPYTFNISSDVDLQAVYTKKEVYALNLTLTSGARHNLVSIEPEGQLIDGVHHYEEGTDVKLTASNNKILTFVGWDDNSTATERIVTMDADKDVTANFSATDYIVGWDLYDDQPGSERAADYKADSENAGLLSLHNESGKTTSWLSRGSKNGQENGKYAARIWKYLSEKNFFEISFSTKGYTHVKVSNALGNNYNSYTNYEEQVSLDGKHYTTVGTFTLPNRGWSDNMEFQLPDSCSEQDKVYVRWYPVFDSPLTGVESDYDGLAIAEIFVTADAGLHDDSTAPLLVSSNPGMNATDVTSNGSIVLNFDEKVQLGSGDATLAGEVLQPIVSGKTVVYRFSGLDYATSYTFNLPAGAITDRNGNAFAGIELKFTTMERKQPSPRLFDAVVAEDGSGDYKTVAEAIDAAPANSAKPWLIFVKRGTYTGHHVIPANKPHLHIIGQGKQFVTIADNRTSGSGQYGISDGATMDVESDNNYFEGIDLINSWGVEQNNGPQALALCSNGDKLAMKNMGLRSYQDTWYTGGTIDHRAYITDSWIEGAVDFFYGKGDVMITNDTINIVRKSGGFIVAPNHGVGTKWGYVFLNNVVTAPGVPSETNVWLGRPWHEAPKTVFINTKFDVTIPATGWYPTMGGLPALWAEYNSMDGEGNPLDLSHRRTDYYYMNGTDTVKGKSETAVLSAEQAASYTVKNVCSGSDDWNPALIAEACAAPQVSLAEGKLTWQAVPYAICYVVSRDTDVIGFTTDTEFALPATTATNAVYKVQSVSEYGALSAFGKAGDATAIATIKGEADSNGAVYDVAGRRVASNLKAQKLDRGVYIVNGQKILVR